MKQEPDTKIESNEDAAMSETKFVCAWCAAPVQKDFNHVGDCNADCKGTFSHPRSGSCRRRFQELTHKQAMKVTGVASMEPR